MTCEWDMKPKALEPTTVSLFSQWSTPHSFIHSYSLSVVDYGIIPLTQLWAPFMRYRDMRLLMLDPMHVQVMDVSEIV